MRAIHLKALGLIVPAVLWAGALAAAEYTVDQHNKTFKKDGAKIDKLTIKAGDTIHFRNMDPWFHNVLTQAELKTFDLGSYPQGQQNTVEIDKEGTVDVECAIHPQMQIEVEVK